MAPVEPYSLLVFEALLLKNPTPEEWQTRQLLINPPGLISAAFVLLAELHGRMGHFPSLIRLRPKPGPIASYEVTELLNLQTIREEARKRRHI